MKAKFHEVAGKTKAIAMALAERHGYGQPNFMQYNGSIWVLRFEVKP
jgi:hypothetical protein